MSDLKNSPFKSASLGWTIPFPNDDAVLIRGSDKNWKKWYKIDLVKNDTLLFIDSMAFNKNGDDLYVSDIIYRIFKIQSDIII